MKRYRRALADVRLDQGTVVTVHVFNNGTMAGCSLPGSRVLISDSGDPTRKHPYTWELVEVGGAWVCVNQKISRQVFVEAIEAREILDGYRIEPEASIPGFPRTDLILHGMDNNCTVGIQSVSQAREGNSCFPETIVPAARRSLERLRQVVLHGHRAIAFFHVVRNDCKELDIDTGRDPGYGVLLSEARKGGVEVMAYRADVTPAEVTLGVPIRVNL
jgi:sugar fermentation stimulation protein A